MPKVHFMNKKKDAVQNSLKILKAHSANWKYKFAKHRRRCVLRYSKNSEYCMIGKEDRAHVRSEPTVQTDPPNMYSMTISA